MVEINTPLRVGVIGTGKHGSRYASHIVNDIKELSLAAISRRSSSGRGQAEQWQCTYHRNWQDLVDDDNVDCVIAVVPPALTFAIAKACAEHNKPILIEKPLAGSFTDARKIVELSVIGGLQLTVGQTLRYNNVIQQLRESLQLIGTLHSFSANQRLEPSTLGWHEDPSQAGAGVSFHTAVHVFDALFYITGLKVKRVSALTRSCHNKSLEDIFTVLVEMENGVVGTVDCSKVSNARSGQFEFIGDKGLLQGEQIYNECVFIQEQTRQEISIDNAVNTIVPLLIDWEKYLRGYGDNPVSGEDGLTSVQICEACLQAAAEKRWIEL